MAEARRYHNLYTVIDEIRPTTIMEIGVWNGNHAATMIKYAQKYNKQIRYYGFDLFETITPKDVKQENPNGKGKSVCNFTEVFSKLNSIKGANIDLHKGYTHVTLPKFFPLTPIDMIFIDGGHSIETIQNDWTFCSQLIHKNSVILMDDYYPEINIIGAKKLITELKAQYSYKYNVELLQPIDMIHQATNDVLCIQMAKITLA